MEDRKSKILSEIDRDREELEELSRKIHDDPELGFEEFPSIFTFQAGYRDGICLLLRFR